MRALVTGGSGFIGSHLVRRLLEGNHKVIVIDKNPTSLGTEFIQGDMRDRTILKSLPSLDVIFHLAAHTSVKESMENPDKYRENVEMTKCLTDIFPNTRIVFASSAAVYGDCDNLPIKESVPLSPMSPYAESKVECERLLKNSTSLRFFNVYGPRQNPSYAGVIQIFVDRILENKPLTIFGDGEQTRDFVYVDDVVNSLILAAESDKIGIYNIATGVETSINQLAELLFKITGKEVDIIHEKERPGDIRRSVADVSKAEDELNFRAKTSLKSGIKEYVNWRKTFLNPRQRINSKRE